MDNIPLIEKYIQYSGPENIKKELIIPFIPEKNITEH